MAELTFDDYRNRLKIQEVLVDAGYTLNKREGLRYPSYVRLDNDGRRIRGDKFLITPKGNCCFQPPAMKLYSVTSFISAHPTFFPEYSQGVSDIRLIHLVCHRLLNIPMEDRMQKIMEPKKDTKPFDMDDISVITFDGKDMETWKKFFIYFKARGINLNTQMAFRHHFFLATHIGSDNLQHKNLSFPMRIPGQDKVVGLEQRGAPFGDGKSYKGMAPGTNASEGLWIASPNDIKITDAKETYWFESAYDAMAYYQLNRKENRHLNDAVFLSTGGNPSIKQFEGVIDQANKANHHLCFDMDEAGESYCKAFVEKIRSKKLYENNIIRETPEQPGIKDWNDALLYCINHPESGTIKPRVTTIEPEERINQFHR